MRKRRFALAFLLASVVVLSAAARVPATPAVDGLELSIAAGMVERVDVHPVGPLVRTETFAGADGALGRTTLKDWTRRPLLVRLRALPSAGDLDDTLRVSVRFGDRLVTRTTLGDLRRLTDPVHIEPGVPVQLSVRAWLPDATPVQAYTARHLDIVLEVLTEPILTAPAVPLT